MKMRQLFAVVGLSLSLAGCAMGMAQQHATIDNLRTLRSANISPVNVGQFGRGPNLSASEDRSVMIRAGQVSPPNGATFSEYLRQTLVVELTADGKFDANSALVITGHLDKSDVDAGMDRGHAVLAATFIVSRSGAEVFSKTFEVHDEWEGNFLGAVAIPAAMEHYTALYSKLVGELLADPQFHSAMHAS